jgi:hypothetical protein
LDLRMQDLLAIKALPPLSERRSRRKTKSSLVQTPLSPAAWLALFGYMQRHEINQLEIRPLGGRISSWLISLVQIGHHKQSAP